MYVFEVPPSHTGGRGLPGPDDAQALPPRTADYYGWPETVARGINEFRSGHDSSVFFYASDDFIVLIVL